MANSVLVTLANEAYLEQAKQLFASAYLNGLWGEDFLLLAHKIPDHQLAWFRERGIRIYECDPVSDTSPGRYPPAVESKYYLLTSFFRRWESVVYLDADMTVQRSLRSLSRLTKPAAVCDIYPNSIEDQVQFHDPERLYELRARFDTKTVIFNSGLLVLPTAVTGDHAFQTVLELRERFTPLTEFTDQLIFNLFLYKRWQGLSAAYNQLHSLAYPRLARHFATVMHPAGDRVKPWHQQSPFYNDWWSLRRQAEHINFTEPPSIPRMQQVEGTIRHCLGTSIFPVVRGMNARRRRNNSAYE